MILMVNLASSNHTEPDGPLRLSRACRQSCSHVRGRERLKLEVGFIDNNEIPRETSQEE